MDTIYSNVAGLDVHQKSIQSGVRCGQQSGKLFREVRSFGTMTRDLRAMADYLGSLGVTHVAMEATGVLWKPVWNVLDGRFTLLLVNKGIVGCARNNSTTRPPKQALPPSNEVSERRPYAG